MHRYWTTGAFLLSSMGCTSEEPEWSQVDVRSIYQATLATVHDELGAPDSFFVDPRPRFLIEGEDGSVRMGDHDLYGDPSFVTAIVRYPTAVRCTIDVDHGCSRASHDRFTQLSEILPRGPRDAGVMVNIVDFRTGSAGARGLVIDLRYTNGSWRVVRVTRGSEARVTLALAQVTTIAGVPTCASCSIVVRELASLGSVDDPNSPAGAIVVARDGRGRFYVAPMTGMTSVGVYGSNGAFIREIGRAGEGPGEYGYAWGVSVLPGDTLVIVDGGLSRYTVLDPGYGVSRVVNTPFPLAGSAFASSSDVIAHANVASPALAGKPLHRLVDGVPVWSSGDDRAIPSQANANLRRITPARDGGVWLARTNAYEIERWDAAGRLVATLRATRSWFPGTDGSLRDQEGRPNPRIDAIWQDGTGLLWVMSSVADSTWRGEGDPGSRRLSVYERMDRERNTVIEVIEPGSGDLVASERFERLYNGSLMTTPGLLQTDATEGSGWIRVRLWQAGLSRD